MTWYSVQLGKAIYTRLVGDTDTGGLRPASSPLIASNAGIRVGVLSPETPMPYIEVMLFSARQDDAMRVRRFEVNVNVSVFTAEASTDYDPHERHAKIIERIAGDWPAQAYGTGPTFGIDRWSPSLTGWTNNILTLEEEAPGDREGVLSSVLTFRTFVNQAAV